MGWDMIKLGAAVLVASFVTGLIVTAPGVTPQVEAHTVEAHTYAINGERLEPVRTLGTACSERGWPYFETSCLRDTSSPTREVRPVRMVGIDRVPAPR